MSHNMHIMRFAYYALSIGTKIDDLG